jgi:hypothetical protein
VANTANRLGGEKMVQYVAKSNLGVREVEKMRAAILELPLGEHRKRVTDKIISDRLTLAEQVKEAVRAEARRVKPKASPEKPELDAFLYQWTVDFEALNDRIRQTLTYKNLIREQFPGRLAQFRSSWEKLRDTCDRLVK